MASAPSVAIEEGHHRALYDRRLHGADRREHPHERARPATRVLRQKPCVVLCDVEDDGSRLEEHEGAFLGCGDLPEAVAVGLGRSRHRLRAFLPKAAALPSQNGSARPGLAAVLSASRSQRGAHRA